MSEYYEVSVINHLISIILHFDYLQTWNEIFNPQFIDDDAEIEEKEREDMFTLRYFVEGLGPLVKAFCNALAFLKNDELTGEHYNVIIEKKPLERITVLSNLGATLKVKLHCLFFCLNDF